MKSILVLYIDMLTLGEIGKSAFAEAIIKYEAIIMRGLLYSPLIICVSFKTIIHLNAKTAICITIAICEKIIRRFCPFDHVDAA